MTTGKRGWWRWWVLLSGSCFLAGLVAAEQPFMPDAVWNEERTSAGRDGEVDVGGAAGRLALGLVLVIGLAGGTAWTVRRMKRSKIGSAGSGRHLELVETMPLGLKRSLAVVRLGDQVLVVGQTEQQLSHIATLPLSSLGRDQVAAEAVLPADGALPAEAADPGPDPAAAVERPAASLSQFQRRLKEVLGR